jgi:urease accessory protein
MNTLRRPGLALLLLAAAAPVFAHSGHSSAGGFVGGLFHPLLGIDHLLAMVAIGAWSVVLRGTRGVFLLPAVFVALLAAGAALAMSGVWLPAVEPAIAASALALGAALAFKARPPTWIACLLIGMFAVFHGHAHGTELPAASNPYAYVPGFMLASALLHLVGVAAGLAARGRAGMLAVRASGAATAAVGLGFLASTM